MSSLQPFFQPRAVAVIGASVERTRIGGRPIHGMKVAGFRGAIYPVNPGRDAVQGYPCFPDVGAVPGPVDLALIALPAAQVAESVRQCVAKGVPAAAVFSAGFGELGGEAARAEAELVAIARAGGMRLLGPNCMGTMNAALGMIGTFTSTIGNVAPVPGHVSVASQSGAFGAHCFTLLRERGVGIDLWATTGNQSDVEVAECILYMAQSPATRVIIGCIEGVRDPSMLRHALDCARAAGKPVVLMKPGRSEVGAAAVASHTAALAGSGEVFNSLLRQHGAHCVGSMDELIDLAYACSFGRYPHAASLGVATVSGGFGAIMADAAAEAGLDLPALPAATQARLRGLVPFAGTRNPLDVTAQFINQPALVEPMLDGMLSEGGYAAGVLFLGASGVIPEVMDALYPSLERVANRHRDRVLALCMIASAETRARVERMGFVAYEDPRRAVHALGMLARFGAAMAYGGKRAGQDVAAREYRALPALGSGCDEHQAKRILKAHGIPVNREKLAANRSEAVAAARAVGFPVAMKVLSADLPHKSDVGGVVLGVASPREAATVHDAMLAKVRRAAPHARINGVLVSPMVSDGVETILGVVRDPVFGPVVLVGFGGIHAEMLRDTACRVAPFDFVEAQAMIRELKGFPILAGARGKRFDIGALARALVRLSRIAADHAGEIESIDINPFVVRRRGALALDALIVPRA